MSDHLEFSRREFLQTSGAAAAALGAAPFAGAKEAIRKPRTIGPDEKLNVACIGIGGKGKGDALAMAGENVVAVCDVETSEKNTKAVYARYPNAKRFTDYREMLTEMDGEIDAVTVSTPDHTHFPAAMMAISKGKHVFVQKPLTHNVWEVRQLTAAARKHGVATTMGNQHHSGEGIRLLCEWIQAGAIGDVHEVHLWTDRPTAWGEPAGMDRPTDTPPVPETLDWNLWLGIAPYRPYHPLYCPKMWRSWWDFGTGALGDMGCHIMDASFWALKLRYPTSIKAETSPVNNETIPKRSMITYEFPKREGMPPVKIVWYDGGNMPPRPKELEDGRQIPTEIGGQLFYGDKGVIMTDAYCESPRIIPESKMQEYLPKRPPKTIPRSPGHVEEWIRACKDGIPAASNFEYSGPLTEMVLLGNLAVRSGKRIEWDSENARVANVPEANELLKRTYREF